jgi:inosine-uridine nucleoside N-ribohydrolase
LTVLLGASVEQDVAGILTVTGNTQALTETSNWRKRLNTI